MSCYMFQALNAYLWKDTLYTCSIWYCHSLREFMVACWCTVCTDRPKKFRECVVTDYLVTNGALYTDLAM